MSQDPFEQFERSRGGLVIPVLIFILGAGLTLLAMSVLHDLRIREEAKLRELGDAVEAQPMLDPGSASVVRPSEASDTGTSETLNAETSKVEPRNDEPRNDEAKNDEASGTDVREEAPRETSSS